MGKNIIKNPLEDFQILQLNDNSYYIANDDTFGVEQTTVLTNSAKPNIVNEETGEPGVVTGEELNAINRDDNSGEFYLYEKSDVYYYPECPSPEDGKDFYTLSNIDYPACIPSTATSFTITYDYEHTYYTETGEQATESGSGSVEIEVTPNETSEYVVIKGSVVIKGNTVEYELLQYPVYYTQYFTLVAIDTLVVHYIQLTDAEYQDFYYSRDNGANWVEWSVGNTVTLQPEGRIIVKGNLLSSIRNLSVKFLCQTGRHKAEGNVMSLIYGDDFLDKTTVPTGWGFSALFSGDDKLVDAENLILPLTEITKECYRATFYDAASLVKGPKVLPAKIMMDRCYESMYAGATSLIEAPQVFATKSAISFAYNMFARCESLTESPVLLPKILNRFAYRTMFAGCTSLRKVTCLATHIADETTVNMWLRNVSENGVFIKSKEMNDWPTGESGIPNGWTVEDYD